ncbi:MAG: DMT family transporter [Hyphomicrobiaceae bacterium]
MEGSEAVYTAALIATAVSAMFGVCANLQSIGLEHTDPRTGAIINVGTSCLIAWIAAPFFLDTADLATKAAGYFALAGLVVPAISMAVSTVSVRLIGPSLTSGLAGTSPMFAMLLAVIWIGEVVTAQILLGAVTVVAGVMLVAVRSKGTQKTWPLWAISLPFVAAIMRGIAHPLIKLGLLLLPSPMTAMLVSTTVSIVVLYGWSKLEGHRMPAISRGHFWFALAGFINGVGMVLLNLALQIGSVSVVSPIIAASPVFTLLTGYFYFKREVITLRTTIAIALIVAGCMLIVVR